MSRQLIFGDQNGPQKQFRCILYGIRLVGSLCAASYQTWWPLEVGEHRFWAQGVTETGGTMMSEVVTITVISP